MSDKQVLLITGGTGKVGSTLVKHFALAGHEVYFTGRNKQKIAALEHEINNAKGILLDHSDPDSTQQLMQVLIANSIFPTALINNVRNINFLQLVENNNLPTTEGWIGEFKLAVIVPTEITMQLANQTNSALRNVINITSIYGVVPPNPNLYLSSENAVPMHYGVSKAAQIHLTKELAIRLSKSNIRVNAVTYGGIEGKVDEAFLERYAKLCPQGKMLTTEDIAGPIEFLLSQKSSAMTGHNLIVDGGWTVW